MTNRHSRRFSQVAAERSARREPTARRIVTAVAGTAVALALLLSYRTSLGDGAVPQLADPAHVVTAPPASASTASPAPTASDATMVADGAVEVTSRGPVQVRVTVASGRITAVTAVQYPSDQRRSQQINAMALPELSSQVLAAQGARIDGVSGATLTTDGYVASLQSALDVLHFAA